MADNRVEYVITLKDLFSDQIKNATKQSDKLNDSVTKTSSGLGGLAKMAIGAFAISGIYNFGKEIMHTSMQVEGLRNQMNFASGSVAQGGKDFDYVRQQSNKMGLDLLTTAESFAKLEGATRGTAVAGQKTRDIFEGVGMASTVMHLSAEQSGGAFYALSQMMSKGKVSAEELNGQLGERIPGALGIASRAMGVSTKGLMEMMQKGELLSEDFLPKFANQLKTEFAGGMEQASQSGIASFNRMNNAILESKLKLGEATQGMQLFFVNGILQVANGISSLINFIKEHSSGLISLTVAVVGLTIAYNANSIIAGIIAIRTGLMTAGTLAYTIATIATTFATSGFTAGMWALNIAMSANPIGAVIAVLALLTAGFVYAYNNIEPLRRGMKASWEVVKGYGLAVMNYLVIPLKMAVLGFKALWHAVSGDKEALKKDLRDMKDAIMEPVKQLKKGIASAKEVWNNPEKEKVKKNLKDISKGKSISSSLINKTGVGALPTKTSEASKVQQRQATQIHINIGKLIESQNIKIENATKDFADKLHTAVSEVLLNVINDANRIATQ
jgi:tape measure domain-containing protein